MFAIFVLSYGDTIMLACCEIFFFIRRSNSLLILKQPNADFSKTSELEKDMSHIDNTYKKIFMTNFYFQFQLPNLDTFEKFMKMR